MRDILISDIEVKLSEFDLIMLVMGLEKLPDSPEEMLKCMQGNPPVEIEEDDNVIVNTALMVKESLKYRLVKKLGESLAEDMSKEFEDGLEEFAKLLKSKI